MIDTRASQDKNGHTPITRWPFLLLLWSSLDLWQAVFRGSFVLGRHVAEFGKKLGERLSYDRRVVSGGSSRSFIDNAVRLPG